MEKPFPFVTAASEEAQLRLENVDPSWTAERLKEFIGVFLKDRKIFVVSNREPYSHKTTNKGISAEMPASGVVTALESIMEACGGVWLAHGSGDADRKTVDANDKVSVPPGKSKYTLKRIWLTEDEVQGYYVGFSNEALWPLCHLSHTRPIFRKEDWTEYRKVNAMFARSLLEEIKDAWQPVILIQDYHFALLPEMIKTVRPDAKIGLFWHIPWPSAEVFSICPWRKELLRGMLGADVIGFHTQAYCNNFFDTVGKEMEALVDMEKFSVTHGGHTALIKPLPISVAFTGLRSRSSRQSRIRVRTPLGAKFKYLQRFSMTARSLGLGVDRMDYTKGILEKLVGIEFFLEFHPAYKERLTFLQIAPPSREGVLKYREFDAEVVQKVEQMNRKFATGDWRPVVLVRQHHSHEELEALYRAADFCLITPLHDGMNLVAKEFVAARNDEAGVLILSKFTGASRELGEALIINPYSAEETAEAIHQSLTMPVGEQRRRMRKLREAVKNYNAYRWAAEFLKAVAGIG